MIDLSKRWLPLLGYLSALIEPLLETGRQQCFLVEAAGPDGTSWNSIEPVASTLTGEDPALSVTRAVARLCGATEELLDPGPEGQRGRGVYYVAASLHVPKRADENVAALGAIVLDIDDRRVGSRAQVLKALGRLPAPSAVVHSGGGVQAAYVLREPLVFDSADEAALTAIARSYLRVAIALERITDADETWWPSHLYRCPCTFHLKDPSRPVLVGVDLVPSRRFNLSDFDEFTGAVTDREVESRASRLVGRLTGRPKPAHREANPIPIAAEAGSPGTKPRVVLPRRVSTATVRLLNSGRDPRYERADGSIDRSRAVYSVALSLLSAGLDEERVASLIAASALRPALVDRGEDAMRWLGFQVAAAKRFLAAGTGDPT